MSFLPGGTLVRGEPQTAALGRLIEAGRLRLVGNEVHLPEAEQGIRHEWFNGSEWFKTDRLDRGSVDRRFKRSYRSANR
jgi:hypothetical protein